MTTATESKTGPRLALATECLSAFAKLPKNVQRRFSEMIGKFHQDAKQASLNFERLEGMKDDKVRSLRVGRGWRAIVLQPPRGDVLLCVWIDHHDEAYAWARNKVFEVNPRTGVFQLYDAVAVEEAVARMAAEEAASETSESSAEPAPSPSSAPARLLADFADEELIAVGVPEPLLPSVRALEDRPGLEQVAPYLPAEVADGLVWLVEGEPLDDVLGLIGAARQEREAVDRDDVVAALERPASKASFALVDDETSLESMLAAPLEKWRVFLHPSQRRIVEGSRNGPVRVLGGAGTGKTVVLLHRVRWLLEHRFNDPDDRIVVTTFTRNLARDLESHLKDLCRPEDLKRVTFGNVHALAVSLVREKPDEKVAILTDRDERAEHMERATAAAPDLKYGVDWLLEEWDQVIQGREVRTRDEWFDVSRAGRGDPLGRKERARLWPVFEAYRDSLREAGLREWPDVVREARERLETGAPRPDELQDVRALLADEVQDLAPPELRFLRALVPEGKDDLFVVGDGHQRIYGAETRLGRCGIAIRGRSHRLKINYRTTEEIRRAAIAVLEGQSFDDLDEGQDTLEGYRSLRQGVAPEVHLTRDEQAEADFLVQRLWKWLESGPAEHVCLAVRTRHRLRQRYVPLLESAGLPFCEVDREHDLASLPPGIRVATMHRMKGLEFPRVLLASVHKGALPPSHARGPEALLRERCLLYVAMTRARDELVVTGFGQPSPLLVAD